MSWADDMRCLYCDGRLPLYRKITNGQFCSAAHRKAYWAEQEKLAVERLHQTHDSLRAYRPQGSVESILGDEPEPAHELTYELTLVEPHQEQQPAWMPQVSAGELPVAPHLPASAPRPRWLADSIAGADPEPIEYLRLLRRPVAIYQPSQYEFGLAAAVDPEILAAEALAIDARPAPITPSAARPVHDLQTASRPVTSELNPVEQGPAPLVETLFAVDAPPAFDLRPVAPIEIFPLLIAMRARLPLDDERFQPAMPSASLLGAGLRQLPVSIDAPAPAHNLRVIYIQAGTPLFSIATPPLCPRLNLAAGRRYAIETRQPAIPASDAPTSIYSAPPAPVEIPSRDVAILRAAPETVAAGDPQAAGLLPLAFTGSPKNCYLKPRWTFYLPQPSRVNVFHPVSALEPLDYKPIADEFPESADLAATPFGPPVRRRGPVWANTIDFWNRAPRDLKMLVFAIPVLLSLALHPSLPKVRVAAPAAASGLQRNFQNVMNQQWDVMRQSMVDRAAIALDEDFRSGLDEWVSRGDATTDWSFDATGFVRPGPLAMYRPSLGLTDYQLQFLGMIDKKALSWVVRAQDFNNYYVIKLVVLKGGPLPTIGVTRYAVINGKAEARADTVVPVDARSDMLYRVRVDAHGDDFALSVQGQMVDSWSEPRLSHGGVGFFAAPGEASRLRWVQVTHQYDMLGRLCAYLAPYNITTSSGSWQQ